MKYEKPRLIAEIGCNHMGDMVIAKQFIKMASVFCDVKYVKFQKRNNSELLTLKQYNSPHPNIHNSYGKSYGEHREYLELSLEEHRELKLCCEEFGIIYGCSVWDLTSAKEITSLEPKYIKIPSACNNHYDMLNWLCENYEGEIHISLGMTTHEEEKQIVELFLNKKRNMDLIIYSCTSGYPVPCEDLCLLEITRLKEEYGDIVKEIGFSGHHNGISMDIAAFTLGAFTIERHFTLNRTWKGTDHAASLEPDGLRRLNRDLNNLFSALQYRSQEILEIEKPQRDKLKFRLR